MGCGIAVAATTMPSGAFNPMLTGALAQQSPDTFTLPEPSPSPTPIPQGPVDERSGVPIAPRLIDPERTRPAPPQEPAPSETPPPGAQPSAAPTSAPADPQSSSITEIFEEAFLFDDPNQLASDDPLASADPAGSGAVAAPSSVQRRRALPPAATGASSAALGELANTQPLAADQTRAAALPRSEFSLNGETPENPFGQWIWALVALCVAAFGAVLWLIVRSGKRTQEAIRAERISPALRDAKSAADADIQNTDASDDLKGALPEGLQIEFLKEALTQDKGSVSLPAAKDPTVRHPPTARPRAAPNFGPNFGPNSSEKLPLALSLAIVSARRSLMNFAVEYRVTIANRSDRALRDLQVVGKLVCARQENAEDTLTVADPILGNVERIGPHQSHTIMGTLELPISQIRMIRQGSVPVFIPLIHVSVERPGSPVSVTRFVIGTPSAANQTRLQPIVLNTQIGGIAGLRADRIQPFNAPDAVESAAR